LARIVARARDLQSCKILAPVWYFVKLKSWYFYPIWVWYWTFYIGKTDKINSSVKLFPAEALVQGQVIFIAL
jgi:hypothetical protein